MTRKPTPNVMGEAQEEIDIVSTTFGPAPVLLPDLRWDGYAGLSVEARVIVQSRTSEIRRLMRKTAQGVIDIGSHLADVKACLEHGQFGAWLDAEFAWTDRTARHFIAVAERFKSENFSDLVVAPSALYLLASPSTPEPARAEVIERARAGETITHRATKETIERHAPPANGLSVVALGAVRSWLRERVPASKRMYALANWRTPPYSGTIKPYIEGLQPDAVRKAVAHLHNNPNLIDEHGAPTPPPAPAKPSIVIEENGRNADWLKEQPPARARADEVAAGLGLTKGMPARPAAAAAVKTNPPAPRDLTLDDLRQALLELFSLPVSATNAEILQAAVLAQHLAVEAANA